MQLCAFCLRKHAGSWGGAKLGIALRSQYGTGDEKAKRQARDIRRGKAELVNDTSKAETGDGRARSVFSDKKRIYVNGSAFGGSDDGGLALGLVLQHEAYRDGLERSGNSAETVRAVKAHTEMALRMQGAGMGGKLLEGVLSYVPELQRDIDNYYGYMYGLSQGGSSKDAAEAAYAAYVDGTYDSSKDYWKLTHGGQLVNDRQGWLKDENGKYISIDGTLEDKPIEGKTQGAKGIETGLLNLLAGTSGRTYAAFTPEEKAVAQQLMSNAEMQMDKNGYWYALDENKRDTNKGKRLNMYDFMSTAGIATPDVIFDTYYNNTVDSQLAKAWGVDLGFERNHAVPEVLAGRYSNLILKHVGEVNNATGLKNKYKFTAYGKDTEVELFKIDKNNPFLDDVLKQGDPAFSDLQYMQPSGCNFMASMAYPQLLTGKIFSANQIKSLWKEAGKDSSILNITNDINLGQGNVRDPDKLTDFAWKELGKTNSRYNNLA